MTNFIAKLAIKQGSNVDDNASKDELTGSLSKLIEGMDLSVLWDSQILPLLQDLDKGCFSCFDHGKKDVIHRFLDAKKEKGALQELIPQIVKGITDIWMKLNEEEYIMSEEKKDEDYLTTQGIWRLVVNMLSTQLESVKTQNTMNGRRSQASRGFTPPRSRSANRGGWNKQSRSPRRGRNFSRSPSRWGKRTPSPSPYKRRSPDIGHYGPGSNSSRAKLSSTSSPLEEDNSGGW